MTDDISGIVPSLMMLTSAVLAAGYLTASRRWVSEEGPRFRSTVAVALLAVLAQATHFAEELLTGFYRQFPAQFGAPSIPIDLFVNFNLAWLGIWVLSIVGLARRRKAAVFPLWFLAIAGALNGLAHPALAVRVGGYFPGLATSPLVGALGGILWIRLHSLTIGRTSRGGTA